MQRGYPPVVIKMDDRKNYYALLSRADNGDNWPFIEYIVESVIRSLQLFLKAADGGDIDEDEDIDKEIALFKMELQSKVNLTDKKSAQSVNGTIKKEIKPLIQRVLNKAKEFDELFFTKEQFFRYKFYKNGNPTSYKENVKQNIVEEINQKVAPYDIDKIEFHCCFKEFKQTDKIFDIELILTVDFEMYKYVLYDFNSKKIVEKYYHESVSAKEIQSITMSFVLALKEKIKEHL